MRISKDEWGLYLALCTALRGTCLRRRVGCVLVDEKGLVLATGYNGVAAGLPHCNEFVHAHVDAGGDGLPNACDGAHSPSGTNLDGCQAIHAEQNALLQCADVRRIYTAYVTTSPCITCVKLLMNTGCKRIVFCTEYPHSQARYLWESGSDRTWLYMPEVTLNDLVDR